MDRTNEIPRRTDVLVVGGGVMGCSVAYHLVRQDRGIQVTVVERDAAYTHASSSLSVGNARVQFSLAQNIEISLYTLEVLRRFAAEMEIEGQGPDVAFKPEGNLFLLDSANVERAGRALELQRRLGGAVDWWSTEQIEECWPLLETTGLAGGTFGSGDGHLDGYAFLMGYRNKAASLGALFVEAQVESLLVDSQGTLGVALAGSRRIEASVVVNCSGAWAAGLLKTAGVRVPVTPIQRQVFVVEPEMKPDRPLPLTTLPSGLYLRSEGEDRILVGRSLPDDRIGFDLRWQESRFNEILWPELVGLIPRFDSLRFERGWAGLYAVNTLDGNAILGEWPGVRGLFLANGFSGHGLQQAPAVGRYLAELILDRPPVLDLSIFSPRRILEDRPIEESALV